APMACTSYALTSLHAAATASAPDRSTIPMSAAAAASAASTSRRAASQAPSVTSSAAPPRARTAPNRPGSDPEEDGLIRPLESDVESVAVVGALRDECRAGGVVGQGTQCPVLRVGLRVVGEVDAGDDAVQQPAREHRHVDVRRLHAAQPVGH